MASYVKLLENGFESKIMIEPVPERVCQLRDAVKAKRSNSLASIDADFLKVFLPGTTKFSEASLDGFASVPPSSPDDPIIVVVPDPQEKKPGKRVLLLF